MAFQVEVVFVSGDENRKVLFFVCEQVSESVTHSHSS